MDVLRDSSGHYLRFAESVCKANPDSAEVQVKCLDLFIAAAQAEPALEAASNLLKHNPRFTKTARAIDKFTAFLKDNSSSLDAKIQAKVKDFETNLLPILKSNRIKAKEAAAMMEHANEALKSKPNDAAAQDLLLKSLKQDIQAHTKVHLAEKMHKRLLKSNAEKKAASFWAQAQELYPHSLYFSDKKDEEAESNDQE